MQTESGALAEFVPGAIWLVDYPVHYAGTDFGARMAIIRLSDGRLMLHSPCRITPGLKTAIEALGPVAWIVAPGTFHHLHVASAQAAFPDAETHICPGVERKQPGLVFDWILGDRPHPDWGGELDQVLVRGNRIIQEVAFFHRASRTLILVDLIELIGDGTPGVGWLLKLWWKAVTFMWNKPRPAPEYSIGWRDRQAAAASLGRILAWDFERIVIAHGDLITADAKAVAHEAWAGILKHGAAAP